MPFFIKDEPFFQGEATDPDGEGFLYTEVRLPMAITEPAALVPLPVSKLDFVLDTGAEYATVSQDHLEEAKIPLSGASGGRLWVTLADGTETRVQTLDTTLWLFSNLPQKKLLMPYRIELNGGVVVCTAPKSKVRPLLGLNTLIDAGLRIDLDCERQLVSVWVPD